jgi:hypothetical protein
VSARSKATLLIMSALAQGSINLHLQWLQAALPRLGMPSGLFDRVGVCAQQGNIADHECLGSGQYQSAPAVAASSTA